MWDILRFLKNPEGENLKDSSSNPSAEAEKRQINAQLSGALERAALAIDKVLSKQEQEQETEAYSVGAENTFLTGEPDTYPVVESPDLEESEAASLPEKLQEVPETPEETLVIEAESARAEVVPESVEPDVSSEREELREENDGELLRISIHLIKPNPFQPRKVMGESELNELSQSIKEFGVLQPILVRRVDDGYELIAGERRLRAASLAGLAEIPAMIVETEPVTQQIIALVENIQRKNLSAIEEALCLNDILSKTGWSQTELSGRMGRSQASIANKLRLLRLDQAVQELVISGKLGERQARSLLSLSTDEQKQLAQRAIDEELSARALELLVENWNSRDRTPRTKVKKNSTDGPAAELLDDIASIVNKHKGRGISAQWKIKQMNQDSLIVEIIVDLADEKTDEAEEVFG
jgi:ParB family chromosome partitioning protein